jgi:hypothetical protein
VVSMTEPYSCILGFLDRSRYFSIKWLLSCTHEAEWTPLKNAYTNLMLDHRQILRAFSLDVEIILLKQICLLKHPEYFHIIIDQATS